MPHLPQLTDGLIQLTTENPANEIGTLTMETLVTVLAIDEQFVAASEHKLTPLAIALFLKNTSDPLVNSIVTDMIKCLLANAHINDKVQQRLLPTLTSILSTQLAASATSCSSSASPTAEQTAAAGKDTSSLLVATLDLVTALVRSASTRPPLSDAAMNAFMLVVHLCLKSADTSILQSGGECLRAYMSNYMDQIVACKDEKVTSAFIDVSSSSSTICIQDLPVDLLVKVFEHLEQSHDLCTVQRGVYINAF